MTSRQPAQKAETLCRRQLRIHGSIRVCSGVDQHALYFNTRTLEWHSVPTARTVIISSPTRACAGHCSTVDTTNVGPAVSWLYEILSNTARHPRAARCHLRAIQPVVHLAPFASRYLCPACGRRMRTRRSSYPHAEKWRYPGFGN